MGWQVIDGACVRFIRNVSTTPATILAKQQDKVEDFDD